MLDQGPTKEQPQDIEIDAQALRGELDRIHDKAQSSSESSSTLGQQRKKAAETLGCHKDALSIIERIDNMSDDKLADFLRSFRPMYAAMMSQWEEKLSDMLNKLDAENSEMDKDLS